MIGSLDIGIVAPIKNRFEQQCICLLEWACKKLKSEKIVDGDWGEENISANIYAYINQSQDAIAADIFVESEHSFYSLDILNNKKMAKSASRIDLVFQHNWEGKRICYYVEAKNVIEYNYTKAKNKRQTKSSKVLKRYVETGMDHYLSAYYPMGCLLGYVLNGTIEGVIDGINSILVNDGRNSEVLQYISGVEPWKNYQSYHSGLPSPISHFFFNFN